MSKGPRVWPYLPPHRDRKNQRLVMRTIEGWMKLGMATVGERISEASGIVDGFTPEQVRTYAKYLLLAAPPPPTKFPKDVHGNPTLECSLQTIHWLSYHGTVERNRIRCTEILTKLAMGAADEPQAGRPIQINLMGGGAIEQGKLKELIPLKEPLALADTIKIPAEVSTQAGNGSVAEASSET